MSRKRKAEDIMDDPPCASRPRLDEPSDDDISMAESILLKLAQTTCSNGKDAKSDSVPESETKDSLKEIPTPPVPPMASEEQANIIKAVHRGCNVKVEAVAGAGKTTTLLLCAIQTPKKRFLILTYNKDLQTDMEKRAVLWGVNNVRCRTYHSAAGEAYGCVIFDDSSFQKAVSKPPPKKDKLSCDVLMIDEAQDMTLVYYQFISYLLRKPLQIVIVGDVLQAINGYKGAKPEFLTECQELFKTARPWETMTLTTSYRLTPSTAEFVNCHILGMDLLEGGNLTDPDLKPAYVATEFKTAAKSMYEVIRPAIDKYGRENVAILAPSPQKSQSNKSPLAQLLRDYLYQEPIYLPSSEHSKVDTSLSKGKLKLLSFNQAKGCEFDCVMVTNFDEKYFTYYEKDWGDRDGVPNKIYVAATRARKQLIVVADKGATLRTIDMDIIHYDTEMTAADPSPPKEFKSSKKSSDDTIGVEVSNLVRHMNPETTFLMSQLLTETNRRRVKGPSRTTMTVVPFQSEERMHEYSEDVSAIYGIMIPTIACFRKTGTTPFDQEGKKLNRPTIIKSDADRLLTESSSAICMTEAAMMSYPLAFWDLLDKAQSTSPPNRTWEQWARMAITYRSYQSGAHHMARQILHYKWVDSAFVEECVASLLQTLEGINGRFEVSLPLGKIQNVVIQGIADFIDEKGQVWEFKCSRDIRQEDLLQLGCYLALGGYETGHLYAILSGEIVTVTITDSEKFLELAVSRFTSKFDKIDIHQEIVKFRAQYVSS